MIKVKIDLTDDNRLSSIIIQGHSQYDKKGMDIVCSAVSILIYGFHLSLINLPDVHFEFEDNKDLLKIDSIQCPDLLTGELRGMTIYLINGLKLLEHDFKKYIKIKLK